MPSCNYLPRALTIRHEDLCPDIFSPAYHYSTIWVSALYSAEMPELGGLIWLSNLLVAAWPEVAAQRKAFHDCHWGRCIVELRHSLYR